MAYSVSQDFKDKIKDQAAQKSCLILFDDLFFSTSDFTDSGVVFNQYFNTSDDLTFGDCPSDTLSFSVVANGALAGYSFGKCRAFLGVQTDSQPYAFGSINAHIEVGGYTWTASGTGLYCDGSLIDSDEYVSLISDGTYVYAVGLSSSYKANIDGSDGSAWTPNRFMAQKLRSGLSAVFAQNTAYVWDGENVLTYEYVPMGVYNVTKPRSTVGDVVAVQDAYDNMSLFDRDASEFIGSLTYPITLSGIYTALCDYIGVGYVSSTFPYSTDSFSASPFSDTSCSLRDILWWIAERARRVAHFDRTGQMDLVSFGTVQETLPASDIGQDGYSLAEFVTKKVTGVLLKGTNGTSLSFGALDTAYVISANPFITTITTTDLNAYKAIPTYVPMELEVLECDPAVDIGDFVNVRPLVDEIMMITNVYNEAYVNAQNEAYVVDAPTYTIPLMNRTVKFLGAIRATYTATGNEVREADLSNTEYNANVAANIAEEKIDSSLTQEEIFNRLTNNGEEQGIYLYDGKILINANYLNAGTITGINIDIGNGNFKVDGETGAVTIKAGVINISNVPTAGTSVITLTYAQDYYASMSPGRFIVSNSDNGHKTQYEGGGLLTFDYATGQIRMGVTADNGVYFVDANGTSRGDYYPDREMGGVYSWSVAANSTDEKSVTFSHTFSRTPYVFVQLNQMADNIIYANVNLSVYDVSTTGFKVRAFNGNNIAVGMPFYWVTV